MVIPTTPQAESYAAPALMLVVALLLALASATTVQAQNVFTVNSAGDAGDAAPGDGDCLTSGGVCTLRAAIEEANALANGSAPDEIHFDIPGTASPTNPHVISPASELPTVTDPVVIDGASEPDYAGSPIVVIDGSNVNDHGLVLRAGGSTVAALVVNDFPFTGIVVGFGDDYVISDNYIGTDATGEIAQGNQVGLRMNDVSNSLVSNNVISGNTEYGISLTSQFENSVGNVIENNFIGTNKDGTADLGNGDDGIRLQNSPPDPIGDPGHGPRQTTIRSNVISGNGGTGVFVANFGSRPGTRENTIVGNHIGTNASGTAPIPNDGGGIWINHSPDNVIGGSDPADRNIISGNDLSGLEISGSDATGNVIRNNYIGTDMTGEQDLGNSGGGILIDDASGNEVRNNLISGNGTTPGEVGPGVTLTSGSTDNVVAGNIIGLDKDGTSELGNANNGLLIFGSSNTISGNTIAGNGRSAIEMSGSSNVICANTIGVAEAGTVQLSNDFFGIWINNGASNNKIGDFPGSGCPGANVIADDDAAVFITDAATSGNVLKGNYVGTNSAGDDFGGTDGVLIRDASDNVLTGNTIAFHSRHGVSVSSRNATPTGNSIHRNSIFSNGSLGINVGAFGVTFNDDGDADTGANRLQNYPEIQSSNYDAAANTVTVTYFVPSDPSAGGGASAYPLTVDFYKADADGQEGKFYLFTDTYAAGEHGACGSAPCAVTVTFTPPSEAGFTGGDFIVATATDANGNTSEFSVPVTATHTFAAGDPAPFDYASRNLVLDFSNLSQALTVIARRSAVAPAGGPPAGKELAVEGYWTLAGDNSSASFTAEVCFDLTNLTHPREDITFSEVKVYKREGQDQTWVAQPTELRPDATNPTQICATGVSGFSQFIVAAESSALPIQLAAFKARVDGGAVVLTWTTLSEKNAAAFEIQRAARDGVGATHASPLQWQTLATVDAQGAPARPHTYTYRAEDLDYGDYSFRLKQIDRDDTATYSFIVEATVAMAEPYVVKAPYPNPFHRQATLEFAVREAERVRVVLYNTLGQRVRVLYDGKVPAGETQHVRIGGAGLSSGVYFVRAVGETFARTRRVVIVR